MEKPDFIDHVCELLAYRFDQYVDRWQVILCLVIAGIILLFTVGMYVRDLVFSRPKVIQAAPSAAAAPPAVKKAAASKIYVYICGAVNKPGVYQISAGTRLNAAIALAGGLLPDADATHLNLAKKLTDGERAYIPKIGEKPMPTTNDPADTQGNNASGPASGNGANGTNSTASGSSYGLPATAWNADGKLNLNAATADDLDKLPGIGPAFIARILDYRKKQNGFTEIAQLRNIEGIGPKTYAKLKPLVFVE